MGSLDIFKKNNVADSSGILSKPRDNLEQGLQILTEKLLRYKRIMVIQSTV